MLIGFIDAFPPFWYQGIAGCPILGASLFLRQGWETTNRWIPARTARVFTTMVHFLLAASNGLFP
jgi:hypothetical protein